MATKLKKQSKIIKGLDKEHLFYCIFSAVIVSLMTGASDMGVFPFIIFVLLSAMFLYISWLVYTLLSRILRYLYRIYLRGYLSGMKKAKHDLEDE